MSKQVAKRRSGASNENENRKTWQQKAFIILSVLLIVSWIAALLVSL